MSEVTHDFLPKDVVVPFPCGYRDAPSTPDTQLALIAIVFYMQGTSDGRWLAGFLPENVYSLDILSQLPEKGSWAGGNPQAFKRALDSLKQQGFLEFTPDNGRWRYDPKQKFFDFCSHYLSK